MAEERTHRRLVAIMAADIVGYSRLVEVDEATAFAPVKNAPGEARDTPQTVQQQMIALHRDWLKAAGVEVADGVAVEISPTFAQNAEEVAAQVRPGMVVTQPRYFC